MSIRTCRIPWPEWNTVDAENAPDYSFHPLPAFSTAKVHKWLMALRNLRIHGSQVNYDADDNPYTVTFDFLLTDCPTYTPPTELSHVSRHGLGATIYLDTDGNPIAQPADDAPGETFSMMVLNIGFAAGSGWDDERAVQRITDTTGKIPFDFQAAVARPVLNTEVDSFFISHTPSATSTLTVDGNSVPLFVSDLSEDATVNAQIDFAPTGGWLTFSGLRNADTGHFTTANF